MFAPSEKRGYLAAHSFWHYVRITALLTLAALMALSLTAAQASVAGSPAISNFSPAGGSAGTVVQINGTGLSSATAVTIGGVPAYFTIQSDSEIDATVPNGAGAGPVTVLTPSGSISSATGFNMTPAPMITSFTPTSGLPGTIVSLTGTGFSTVTSAAVNGVNASFQIHTDSSMNVTVPNSATTGPISVTNPGGTATSATNFTVLPVPAPTISSFSPTSGSVGTDVTIQGTGFATTTSVQFNGTSTTNFLAHNNDVMDVIVPVGASTGPITVINPAGSGTSASDFVVPSAPSITGFSPTSGLPGTLVHVTGTGFTGTTSVTVNGVPASYLVHTDSTLDLNVPNSATTGPITVVNTKGSATSGSNFTVLAVGAPTISSFTPTTGPAGTIVSLTGTGFSTVTSVTVNGMKASFLAHNDVSLDLTVPIGATTGPITVVNPAGSATTSTPFVVPPVLAPTVSSFTPASGPFGTLVHLTGTGFSTATSVEFNGVPTGHFLAHTDSSLDVVVPVGATTGVITVVNGSGSGSSSTSFTVTP